MDGDLHTRLQLVHDATSRYLQLVDGLTAEQLAAPSVLPGWSRGHVVAHVALNAAGFARALHALAHGEVVPVYGSQQSRDEDIETWAGRSEGALRELTLDACGRWRTAMRSALGAHGRLERVPGVPWLTVPEVVDARWREVEIHHADLALGYRAADWPEAFLDHVFNVVVHDRREEASMLLRTPDGDVPLGDGAGPVVSGSRADLAWWLLGRGEGDGLTADGELPRLGPWTRRTPEK